MEGGSGGGVNLVFNIRTLVAYGSLVLATAEGLRGPMPSETNLV